MERIPKQKEPLVTHIYTADPSAHVFEGKVYIYPSHDRDLDVESNDNGDQYMMEDYHVLSMDNLNSPVVDHGIALHLDNVTWAKRQMWAPDAAFKNNTYYLYFPAKDKDDIFRIGVATSKSPAGPFIPQSDYIKGSYSIDPAVFVDEDNKSYIYIGGLWGGQLEKWQTGEYVADAEGPLASEPALGPVVAELSEDMLSLKETLQEIAIVDDKGNPILAGDEERRFFEAPWVYKHNGYYYLTYSTGTTHYIAYAMSKSPKGPFVYKGRILEPVIGWTTHHSVVQIEDKWYLFYHDSSLSNGVNQKRCVKYTEITYNDDGTINTIEPYK